MRGESPQSLTLHCTVALAESGFSLALAHGQLLFLLPGHRGMSGGSVRRGCRGLMLGLLALLASVLFTQHPGPWAAQSACPGLARCGLPPVFVWPMS